MAEITNKGPGVLHLTLGLDVFLTYDDTGKKIKTIQLSKSRLGELFRNNIVTRTSITRVKKIGLIIGVNNKLVINIEEIVGLDEKGPIVLNVDNEKTQAKYADKDIFQMSYFEFIASNEQELSSEQIEMLYKLNQKYTAYLEEQISAIKAKRRKRNIRRSAIAHQKNSRRK
ncbi:hypothetical protein [Enterococcus gallinarum]|uniref:hypothetical protein n=1 Tax=Enterococcus gallinarum TaxID=1353 RepID=UPI0018AB53ED|nr:hypothetical protein [Enterococcus gallinarum]